MFQTGLSSRNVYPLESHDIADRGAAANVQIAAVPDDYDVDDPQQQAPGGPEDGLAALGEQLLAEHRMPPAQVVECLPQFAPEGPDDPNPRERLAHAAINLFRILAHRTVDGPDAPGEDKTQ